MSHDEVFAAGEALARKSVQVTLDNYKRLFAVKASAATLKTVGLEIMGEVRTRELSKKIPDRSNFAGVVKMVLNALIHDEYPDADEDLDADLLGEVDAMCALAAWSLKKRPRDDDADGDPPRTFDSRATIGRMWDKCVQQACQHNAFDRWSWEPVASPQQQQQQQQQQRIGRPCKRHPCTQHHAACRPDNGRHFQ
jgi:hypothetical protein